MTGSFSKIVIRLIIPVFLVFLVIALVHQNSRLKDETQVIKDQLEQYSHLISIAISDDIENLNVKKISSIIDSLKSSKYVQSIEITDEKNRILARRIFSNKEPFGLSENLSFYFNWPNKLSSKFPIYKKEKKHLTFIFEKEEQSNIIGYINISANTYSDFAHIYSETITLITIGFFFLVSITVFIWTNTKESLSLISKVDKLPLPQMLSISSFLQTNSPELNEFISKIENKIKEYKDHLDLLSSDTDKKKKLLEYENESLKSTCKNLTEKYRNHRTMVASVGHDLKSPIDVIQKTSELLTELLKMDVQEMERVNRILRSAKEIDFLAKNLMDSSLLDSDQKRVEVDLIEFAIKCAGSARILNNNKDVLIYPNIEKDIFNYVYMNEEWVNRIINNLMSNAIKFTQSGKISLTINSYRGDSGDVLRVTVKDQGTGIPASEQGKIFKEFYQAGIEEYKPQGLGLGLYICKYLIEGMGGEIFIRSNEGEGTEVTFTIPISIYNKVSPAQSRIQKELETIDFSMGMLVVDSDLKDSHRSTLEALGLHCDYYSSIEDLGNHDVIIGVNLYDFSDEDIRRIKTHCKRLITFEIGSDYPSNNLRPCVDEIIHKHVNPYQYVKTIIKVGKDSKIEDIPRIGKVTPITSNSTANFLSSLSIEEEKVLDNTVILIVEDHPDHLQTMKELLSFDGAIVDTAKDYDEAFKQLKNRRYDIVITDYTLGSKEETGLDIAKNILTANQNKNTSVICCTGNRSVTRDPEASKYFGSILDKPTNHHKLVAQIMKLKTKNKGIMLI